VSQLTITIETNDDIGLELLDPHEPSENIVDIYNEWALANGYRPVTFVSAEWSTP
jgi:hypothetical protein